MLLCYYIILAIVTNFVTKKKEICYLVTVCYRFVTTYWGNKSNRVTALRRGHTFFLESSIELYKPYINPFPFRNYTNQMLSSKKYVLSSACSQVRLVLVSSSFLTSAANYFIGIYFFPFPFFITSSSIPSTSAGGVSFPSSWRIFISAYSTTLSNTLSVRLSILSTFFSVLSMPAIPFL